MLLADIRSGDRVMIVARDAFYAYVDGWRGRVIGFDQGCAVAVGPGMLEKGVQGTSDNAPDLTLYVPPDQLAHTV